MLGVFGVAVENMHRTGHSVGSSGTLNASTWHIALRIPFWNFNKAGAIIQLEWWIWAGEHGSINYRIYQSASGDVHAARTPIFTGPAPISGADVEELEEPAHGSWVWNPGAGIGGASFGIEVNRNETAHNAGPPCTLIVTELSEV